tara:strand:+ start:354 stop:518 length:165 start_codon:yes stop_codon:yes gene_type:complete
MPSDLVKEALKTGVITQKQFKNLNENLLEAIVKKKMGIKSNKKPKKKKARKKKS